VSHKPRLIKTIEAPEGITRVYENGYLESFITEDAYIDVPFLIEGKKQLEETGLKKFYVISEGAGFFRISKAARQLSASKEYSSHLAAVAVITSHVSTRLIVDLYHKIDKPVVPTKAFTDRNLARKWLFEMMRGRATEG